MQAGYSRTYLMQPAARARKNARNAKRRVDDPVFAARERAYVSAWKRRQIEGRNQE